MPVSLPFVALVDMIEVALHSGIRDGNTDRAIRLPGIE